MPHTDHKTVLTVVFTGTLIGGQEMSNKKRRFQRRLLERRQRMTESTAKEPSLSRADRIQQMMASRKVPPDQTSSAESKNL